MIPRLVRGGKPLRVVADYADAPTSAPALGEDSSLSLGEDMTPGNGGIFRVSSRRFIPNPIVPTTSVFLSGVLKSADSDAIWGSMGTQNEYRRRAANAWKAERRVTLLGAGLNRARLQTKRPRRSGALVHHETRISDLLEHLPWRRELHAPVTFDRAAHRD